MVVAGSLLLAVSACGSGGEAAEGVTKVVLADAGLGTEADATKAAVEAFEADNPDIDVEIQSLSTDGTQYMQQLRQRLVAGDTTPDVFKAADIEIASLSESGWLYDLGELGADPEAFVPGAAKAGQYDGKTVALPWFANVEGLFYRTDLVSAPPTTTEELVAAAKAGAEADPDIEYGFVFEGAKYEGAVTVFNLVATGLGGGLDFSDIASDENVAALEFLADAIHAEGISPEAVTTWQEGQVQEAFTSGQSVFSTNWPFVFGASAGSPTEGKIGFAPFPGGGGTIGSELLAINAGTEHSAAAWKLVQYLTSVDAQVARAEATGNPPSLLEAYDDALFEVAPYFEDVETVAATATSRPATPHYTELSAELQTALSAVFAGQATAREALESVAAKTEDIETS